LSGTIWTKFFWSDWLSEPALQHSSRAARGLWMDMLCIAAAHDPIGYVSVAGTALTDDDIARMSAGSPDEVPTLLSELERNGVFSRTRNGTIYSRRMVGDAKKASTARKNGRKGGNPTLSKQTSNSASDNGHFKPPDKPHIPSSSNPEKKKKGASALGANPLFEALPDWIPRSAWDAWAEMRQVSLRKPIKTARTVEMAVNELARLRDLGNDPLAMLEEATLKSWTSFYPVKATVNNAIRPSNALSATDEMRRKLQLFRDRGVWLSVDGPAPTDPDCCLPKQILAEFGFGKAAA
jgi:hypothetical protein